MASLIITEPLHEEPEISSGLRRLGSLGSFGGRAEGLPAAAPCHLPSDEVVKQAVASALSSTEGKDSLSVVDHLRGVWGMPATVRVKASLTRMVSHAGMLAQ